MIELDPQVNAARYTTSLKGQRTQLKPFGHLSLGRVKPKLILIECFGTFWEMFSEKVLLANFDWFQPFQFFL